MPASPTAHPPRVRHPTNAISRAQPAHHFIRASEVICRPRPGGRGSPPLRRVGRFRRATGVVRRPKAGRRGRRPLRAVCILHAVAYNVRAPPAYHFVRASEVVRRPRPGGRGSPPLQGIHISPTSAATPQSRRGRRFPPLLLYPLLPEGAGGGAFAGFEEVEEVVGVGYADELAYLGDGAAGVDEQGLGVV